MISAPVSNMFSSEVYFPLIARCWLVHVHRSQPTILVGQLPAGDAKEPLLDRPGDRAAFALADLDVVDGAYWRDFRRCPGEEDLICDVQHVAGHKLLADFVAEFA